MQKKSNWDIRSQLATSQFLSELWSNNSGEMSEFDSELYFRVAFYAFLIPLGSGKFSIIRNLS